MVQIQSISTIEYSYFYTLFLINFQNFRSKMAFWNTVPLQRSTVVLSQSILARNLNLNITVSQAKEFPAEALIASKKVSRSRPAFLARAMHSTPPAILRKANMFEATLAMAAEPISPQRTTTGPIAAARNHLFSWRNHNKLTVKVVLIVKDAVENSNYRLLNEMWSPN